MIATMELCTARGVSNLPLIPPPKILPPNFQFQSFNCRNQSPFALNQLRSSSGLRQSIDLSLRSSTSDGTSTETTPYEKINLNEADSVIDVENTRPNETNQNYDIQLNDSPQEGSLVDDPLQLLKFLEDLDIKFDYEDTYSVLVFGGGAALALWLSAAVVGAVDSIPVLPKVLELIGLGYTIWFSSRYLIFKENRDELFARVEQIKQQVLGSKDD
ncbi:hypothetical protein ABFS82_08G221600 [Erythranthe guttata]|uniref:Cyanobacterial aminoacyl-tRNA synthetase CAAD domain-containing protein n=1 Tax=Erythranthe guttata TaxID=4155 RepID=A0A022QWS0_ERYGU|nr:PREDICTED: protein CURVATURE THYLAKOID 1D, chloroplastic [Erythranthe guttata]EYU30950.1 hypothetical protein MIMGU_mgv1a013638mg [Erythranthe guttata]|eukprot:XP_012844968.1 PREDICTED: protein CURVATURE THYLAKOID 1D, chloroplastic [Erythranthe guttata]